MDVSELRELATFVVSQNYMHHLEGLFSGDLSAEIEDIYQEEFQQREASITYIVRDMNDDMIGSIRVQNGINKRNFRYKKYSAFLPWRQSLLPPRVPFGT